MLHGIDIGSLRVCLMIELQRQPANWLLTITDNFFQIFVPISQGNNKYNYYDYYM